MVSKEATDFIFGLEQCRTDKGMVWHGDVPEDIYILFQLPTDFKGGYITGVYVEVQPKYTAFVPKWETNQ